MSLTRTILVPLLMLVPCQALSQTNFEMHQPAPGNGEVSVIGAAPVSRATYPATFIFKTPGGGCTSTLVGNRTILTAAHCVDNNATGTITVNDSLTVDVKCEHHPNYITNRTMDFALCLTTTDISGILFEKISTSLAFPRLGHKLKLVGYGCRENGGFDRNFGTLYHGDADVRRLPVGDDIDTITSGGAALCYGDSGGAAYYYPESNNNTRVIVGINSRGNIRDTSYISSTATLGFVEFGVEWSERHRVTVCGITPGAKGCRG